MVPRNIEKQRLTTGRQASLKNRRCLNSLLTSNVRTVDGIPIIVITGMRLLLFLFVWRTQGRDFWIKIERNVVTFIPKGLTTRCKKSTKRHIELGEFPLRWFHKADKTWKKPVSLERFSLICLRISFSLLSEKYWRVFLSSPPLLRPGTGRLSPQYKELRSGEGVD